VPESGTITSRADAIAADAADPLASLRARFTVPDGITYLDGNSLGALPAHVPGAVAEAIATQWGQDLITSWNKAWWELPARIGERIGRLVGAAPGQVLCGDSTSVQLFQAVTALARLRPGRNVVLTDAADFSTDRYLAGSAARLVGARCVNVAARDVAEALDQDVAVVALSAVDYRTGELFDAPGITSAVHEAGALMLWDLCHAVGAVPFALDAIGADAAVGCSYKYLNGGPGAPAWVYFAERHHRALDLPLTGWQGHANPFAFAPGYEPAAGIGRARIGTPPVLSMVALDAALDVFDDVSVDGIRAKSLRMTQLVMDYARTLDGVEVMTPARRGSQVALRMSAAYEVTQALIARGVICDFRAPELVRLGFAPLYLTYTQVWDAMDTLRDVLESGTFRDPSYARGTAPVT
jgi:kynureninase